MAHVVRMLAAERNRVPVHGSVRACGVQFPCPVSEACERTVAPQGRAVHGRGTSVSASARSTRFGRRVPARLRLTRFVLELCSDGERFLAKLPARDACARGVVLNGLIVSVVPAALLAACIRFRTPAIWPDFKARQTHKDSVMVLIAKKKSHESSSAYGPRYSTRSPHGR